MKTNVKKKIPVETVEKGNGGKNNTLSKANVLTTQSKLSTTINNSPLQKKANKTGLPDNLKSGIEGMSGIGLDDVKVHYNSNKPAQMKANAFTQGNQIHIGPGQNKYLGHEAWHVVQQKQGRVKPTKQEGNLPVNDSPALEREADVMGGKALQFKIKTGNEKIVMPPLKPGGPVQYNRFRNGLLGAAALGIGGGLLFGSGVGVAAGLLGGALGYFLSSSEALPDISKMKGIKKGTIEKYKTLKANFIEFEKNKKTKKTDTETIHDLFSQHYKVETGANQILNGDIPQALREVLLKLLKKLETDHYTLTQKLVQNNGELWTRPSLGEERSKEAKKLWKQLINKRSKQNNIKILTKNKKFRNETHSHFARLLQGPVGIKLLSELNAPQEDKERRITVSDNFFENLPTLGFDNDKDSSAIPVARQLRDERLHELLPNKKKNVGTGSYVQVNDDIIKSYGDYRSGIKGEAIHTPKFIDLGHELGHAHAQLTGTSLSQHAIPPTDYDGDTEDVLWTNDEEKRNITEVENPLRNEHGIAPRKYHKNIVNIKRFRLRRKLGKKILNTWDSVPFPLRDRVRTEAGNPQQLLEELDQKMLQLDKPKVAEAITSKVKIFVSRTNSILKK